MFLENVGVFDDGCTYKAKASAANGKLRDMCVMFLRMSDSVYCHILYLYLSSYIM